MIRILAILLGVALGLTVICGWRGARPAQAGRAPRLVPWRPLMAFFAMASFILFALLAQSWLSQA